MCVNGSVMLCYSLCHIHMAALYTHALPIGFDSIEFVLLYIFILCERRLTETTKAGQKENDSLKRDRTSYARIHEQMQCGIFFAWVRERAYTIPKRLKSLLALMFLTSFLTMRKQNREQIQHINEFLPCYLTLSFPIPSWDAIFPFQFVTVSCFLRQMHLRALLSFQYYAYA